MAFLGQLEEGGLRPGLHGLLDAVEGHADIEWLLFHEPYPRYPLAEKQEYAAFTRSSVLYRTTSECAITPKGNNEKPNMTVLLHAPIW